jgi:hypothetical protein
MSYIIALLGCWVLENQTGINTLGIYLIISSLIYAIRNSK